MRKSGLLLLALKFSWAHRAKFVLLSLLVAVGMTVFLVVTELSRVSSTGLDDAIAADVGEAGTYAIEVYGDLGLSIDELAGEVDAALQPFASRPPLLVEVLPLVQPECPPYRELGPQRILILRDHQGDPAQLPFGENLPAESEFCLDGQEIPATALYLPTPAQQREFGVGLFIDSRYRSIVRLSTTDPTMFRFVVVTQRQTDDRDAIQQAVTERLHDHAARHGVAGDYALVLRVDTGDSIRRASEGIRVVYLVIGWGVIILGGLGLLVAELIVVRDRTWFFGLARALGAGGRHVATLVILDVLLTLVVGTGLALVLAAVSEPTVRSFAASAFGVEVQLLQPSSLSQLVIGGLVVLGLAAGYPAIKATRPDPLDVLEPSS
jgi:hypothetical protein